MLLGVAPHSDAGPVKAEQCFKEAERLKAERERLEAERVRVEAERVIKEREDALLLLEREKLLSFVRESLGAVELPEDIARILAAHTSTGYPRLGDKSDILPSSDRHV